VAILLYAECAITLLFFGYYYIVDKKFWNPIQNQLIAVEKGHIQVKQIDMWVIPCQINQEFRITSWILTKLSVFVVPMGLITHTNFLPHIPHGFWFMTTNILNISWKFSPSPLIELIVTLYCIIILKHNFHWLKTIDQPFKWSLNYGILT